MTASRPSLHVVPIILPSTPGGNSIASPLFELSNESVSCFHFSGRIFEKLIMNLPTDTGSVWPRSARYWQSGSPGPGSIPAAGCNPGAGRRTDSLRISVCEFFRYTAEHRRPRLVWAECNISAENRGVR